MPNHDASIDQAYQLARNSYAGLGVDTDRALERLALIPISLQCWQGDDVGGFENRGGELGGGLAVTGSYPGKARNAAELRADLEQVFSLVPGRHRLSLHGYYAETDGKRVDRNELEPSYFAAWIEWARSCGIGLDFNPTFFAHPKAATGFTLSHTDASVRRFWIEHGIACRRIGAEMGKALGTACVTNLWIPDGFKDTPIDRKAPRQRLEAALNEIFDEAINPRYNLDAVEPKLFGLGSELRGRLA